MNLPRDAVRARAGHKRDNAAMSANLVPERGLGDGTIRLRPPREDDVDAITAACQDPEIPRWTSVPSPYTADSAREFLSLAAADTLAGRAACLLVVAEDDGALLGSIGLMTIDRARGYAEIGYWLAAGARGRGIMTRAVRLLCDHAAVTLGLTTIEILTDRDNARSRAVAERAGFTRTEELRPRPRIEPPGPPTHRVYVWRAPSAA